MTSEQLKMWRAFCEWLDERKYKCAYVSNIPRPEWRRLVYIGGNPAARRAAELRREARLVFYYRGWGWRLRKNWRERLIELEKSTPAENLQGCRNLGPADKEDTAS
jgi:hypothetical protein